jgi:hypothetical protein
MLVGCFLCGTRLLAEMTPRSVTLDDAQTGNGGVVVLHLSTVDSESSGSATYTLGCNSDEQSCVIPEKDKTYILRDSDEAVYRCQNVALFKDSDRLGVYCLQGVH